MACAESLLFEMRDDDECEDVAILAAKRAPRPEALTARDEAHWAQRVVYAVSSCGCGNTTSRPRELPDGGTEQDCHRGSVAIMGGFDSRLLLLQLVTAPYSCW